MCRRPAIAGSCCDPTGIGKPASSACPDAALHATPRSEGGTLLVKRLADCEAILAHDGCRLKEFLHPRNDAVDIPYSLAVATVDPGQRTHPHRLEQTEVYYLLSGSGVMHIGGEKRPVCAGDLVFIPAGETQWIENPGINPLVFAAIVSPPWCAQDDRRVESPAWD